MENPVLPSCERVMETAKYVSINPESLDETARKFSKEDLKIPTWDLPVFPKENSIDAMDFFMLGNTINFAFRDFETKQDFTTEYAGQEWRGAMAMWASLKRALDSGKPILEGSYLKWLSDDDVSNIFSGKTPIPMLRERAEILRETGNILVKKYGNYFTNVVWAADHSLFNEGQGLVERLVNDFPSFRDYSAYKQKEVIFNKRAQLAAGMLYGRFKNKEPFTVRDIEKLTVFADYGLPKTMRHLKMLVYSPSLAKTVDNQELIEKDSKQEVEIRAATVCAADSLAKKINQYKNIQLGSDNAINALHIDYRLWSESRKINAAHHLTRTTAY